MKRHIPNIITCCNLLSGAVAVWLSTQQLYVCALGMIIIGALFDFCDGLSARALGVSSPIGKELDSLADDITFGLAPAMMLFCFLHPLIGWWALLSLVMAAFSALRLAKFNLDERQTTNFIGLATPANALFWGSLVATLNYCTLPQPLYWGIGLLLFSFVSCWLLVAEIPFFSLKFHNLSWHDNRVRFVFLAGAAVVVVAAVVIAIIKRTFLPVLPTGTLIIAWYTVLSIAWKVEN